MQIYIMIVAALLAGLGVIQLGHLLIDLGVVVAIAAPVIIWLLWRKPCSTPSSRDSASP